MHQQAPANDRCAQPTSPNSQDRRTEGVPLDYQIPSPPRQRITSSLSPGNHFFPSHQESLPGPPSSPGRSGPANSQYVWGQIPGALFGSQHLSPVADLGGAGTHLAPTNRTCLLERTARTYKWQGRCQPQRKTHLWTIFLVGRFMMVFPGSAWGLRVLLSHPQQ